MPAPGTRLSTDQILDAIHEVARDGEGADRRWALNQLKAQEVSVAVDKPKTEAEVIERIARQLRGVGLERAKDCFRAAYPVAIPLQWTEAKKRGKTYVPITVAELVELFPETPVDAFHDPVGYPKSGSQLAKKRWIADKAVEMNDARKAREREAVKDDALATQS